MGLIKSRFGRLTAAIGIGLLVESLLFIGVLLLIERLPQPWDERVFAIAQEPAYHLVGWIWSMQRHGFEEQAGFVILVPLVQWGFWSAISYWVLSRKARAHRLASV
jgi:hypothetical protein